MRNRPPGRPPRRPRRSRASCPSHPTRTGRPCAPGMVDHLTATATPAWTDHNAADPGITLLEVLAYGLADLHYRTAERHLDGWPLEVRAWDADAGRHWHATLPAGGGIPRPTRPTPR